MVPGMTVDRAAGPFGDRLVAGWAQDKVRRCSSPASPNGLSIVSPSSEIKRTAHGSGRPDDRFGIPAVARGLRAGYLLCTGTRIIIQEQSALEYLQHDQLRFLLLRLPQTILSAVFDWIVPS